MEGLVSKGFLIYAQNTDSVDYVEQSYALALSIKHSQKEITSVSLITNDPVPKKYQKVFDQIIPIPWFTDNPNSILKGENRWKLYHVSPYDETIVLDSDMLLLEDITEWWYYCKNYDIKFCSRILNYKLDIVNDTYHRKAFIANQLTSPYYALHYFKKSDAAHEFYKVLEFVCNNWAWCYEKFAPNYYQDWLSMDLASAIAIEITGMHNYAVDVCCPLEFIHMKVPLQEWKETSNKWQDTVSSILNSRGELVVGNIKQSRIFHYVEKQFITKTMLDQLEKLAYAS
jgi:hypothetical protein